MGFVVEILLKAIVGWINAHPDSAFSRFILKQRGPRTDVARMSRVQRPASALAFLLWGCLFLGLWLLTAYLTFGLRVLSHDNPLVEALIFGLALLAGCGFLGGLYLLVRVLANSEPGSTRGSRSRCACPRESCGAAVSAYLFSWTCGSARFSFNANRATRSPSRRALSSSPSLTPGSSGPVIAAAPTSAQTLPVLSF